LQERPSICSKNGKEQQTQPVAPCGGFFLVSELGLVLFFE